MKSAAFLGLLLAISCPTTSYAAITPRNILTLAGPLDCGAFGQTLASADFNGDGQADIVVGSPFSFLPSGLDGKVYVYYGGPGSDSLPDVILSPPPNTVDFGSSVSPAGDFNGDGFDDLVVGDHYFSSGFFVYFGGPSADDRPDLFLSIPFQFFRQPARITSGDVNGDGFSDLIATFGTPRRRAFIYFGGPGADGLPDLELKSPDEFQDGPIVLDENGDGVKDIVMRSDSGIGVYFGGTALDSLEDAHLTGSHIEGDYIGTIQSGGDVNGDGFDDLMVSASDSNGGNGRVFVYLGGRDATVRDPDVTLQGDDSLSSFGATLTAVGDVDQDGFGDILVGDISSYYNLGGTLRLYRGGSPMDTTPDATIVKSTSLASFPWGLTAVDVNGDGIAEGLGTLQHGCYTGEIQTEPNQVFVYDFAAPLACRAFVQGNDRTIRLGEGGSVCVRLEPVRSSFILSDVNLASIRLSAQGGLGDISPESAKHVISSDTDGNGVAELPIWFARADLSSLFPDVHRRDMGTATLEGVLSDSRRFSTLVAMTVLKAPAGPHASLSPNPMNPVGTLAFRTAQTGEVTLRLYDVSGRMLREIIRDPHLAAGEHSVILDGKDDQGGPLSSGVYFYSIKSPGEAQNGRFVIAR